MPDDAERRKEIAAKGRAPERPVRRTAAAKKPPPPPVKELHVVIAPEDAERFEKVCKMSGSKSDVEHVERALSFYDSMLSTDLDMTFEGDNSEEMLVERSSLRNVRSYTLKPIEPQPSGPVVPPPAPKPRPAPPPPQLPVLGAVTLSTGRKVKVVLQYPPPTGLSEKEKTELRTARVTFGKAAGR